VSVVHTLTSSSITVTMPRSSVSLLLGLVRLLRVSLVSRVTARSLHNDILGCLSPSGEWS